jgi:tetratricopeptide (TPR) repeat protein
VIPILVALAAVQAAPAAPAAPNSQAAPARQAAPAPTSAAETRYRACAALARSDPNRAIETAETWQREGGSLEARQCLGLAYVALEMWGPAATAFEQAALEAERAQDARRPDLLVQAGNAWLAVEETANAIRAFDAALATNQLSDAMRGEVHLDRARARVSLDDAAGARADVDQALQLVAADPFAWYMSAALARRQNDLPRARTDIERAMQLAPENPDILLLGGTLAGLTGNMAEAERLYRRVAEGAPDTPAGQAARASLATLREVEVPAANATVPVAAPAAPTVPATTSPPPAAPPPQSR